MLKIDFFIVLFVACTSCAATRNNVDKEIEKFITDGTINNLSEEERSIYWELQEDLMRKYLNEEEFWTALKERLPHLHKKIKGFAMFIGSTINTLGKEAKAFAAIVIDDIRALHAQLIAKTSNISLDVIRKKAREHLSYYENLSPAAKKEIMETLPFLTMMFADVKMRVY